MRIVRLALLAFIFALPVTALGQQAEYLIGAPCLVPPECSIPEIEALFREAYRRLGAGVEFVYLPMLRDLDDADRGILDGSALRTMLAIREYGNLIAIDVPLGVYSLAAFTTKPGLRIASPEDLKGLTVGVVRGSLASVRLCRKRGIRAHPVNDIRSAFDMLREHRVDAVLTGLLQGKLYCEHRRLDARPSAVLCRENLYHTLNSKHRDLVPKLTAVFREMVEDGTIGRTVSSVFDPSDELIGPE